jgi:hypothetical protein
MTTLLDQAFQAAQQLPNELQDELAQQLLDDIQNELRWQETLSAPAVESDVLTTLALAALAEDDAGETEDKGFGED